MSAAYSSGGARQHFGAIGGEALVHVLGGERLAQLLVEPLDDGPRGPGRCHQPVAQGRLVAGQAGFSDRGQIGQQARALRAAHRQRPQQTGLGLPVGGRDRGEHHRDMAAQQIGDGRAGAFVGNMGELDARHGAEQLAGQVADGADAGRAVVDLARMRLRIGDQLDATECTGTLGCTTSMVGAEPMRPMAAKSLRGSKPALA